MFRYMALRNFHISFLLIFIPRIAYFSIKNRFWVIFFILTIIIPYNYTATLIQYHTPKIIDARLRMTEISTKTRILPENCRKIVFFTWCVCYISILAVSRMNRYTRQQRPLVSFVVGVAGAFLRIFLRSSPPAKIWSSTGGLPSRLAVLSRC